MYARKRAGAIIEIPNSTALKLCLEWMMTHPPMETDPRSRPPDFLGEYYELRRTGSKSGSRRTTISKEIP